MKISKKKINEIGLLLKHSQNHFEGMFYNYMFKYNKSDNFHYFDYIDFLKEKIELIRIKRGAKNKHYLKYNKMYKDLLVHVHEDLKFYRKDFPMVMKPLDLSHIDLSDFGEEQAEVVLPF